MRLAIIGQAAFGEAVLRRLGEVEETEVVGVSAPGPVGEGRRDALWEAASGAGMPVVETASLREPGGLERWAALKADLCVMAFVTDILPSGVFALPRLGTIQYHPSLLPLHRGIASMNWPIIFGEAETGLTVFWPDVGIDTGPILLQKRCAIGPDDTVGSLYFERLFPMGVDALAEAVALVGRGAAPRHEQRHELATYEPPCRDEHARIAWHEPATRIYALIRGCNPQPGAWTTFEGEKVRLFDCRLTGQQRPGMPGRVLAVESEGVEVRLNGGVLRVMRVQPAGGKKMPAAEWAASVGLREGSRLR